MTNPTAPVESREDRLVVVGMFAAFTYLFLANSWVGDDAYITFRGVDNFVHGLGLRWNAAERVQAFTSPLWLLFLSPFYAVTGEIFCTSLAVSFVLCIAALALARRSVAGGQWILLMLLLFSSKAFIDYTSSGLEYPMLYLFVVLLFIGLDTVDRESAPATPAASAGLTLLAAVAFVCRMDIIVMFAPALAWLAWRRWRADGVSGLRRMALAGLPAIGWLMFSVVYYGFPFPNTYYAKASAGFPGSLQMSQGLGYVLNSLRFDPVTMTTIGIAAGCAAGGSRRQKLIGTAALLTVGYVIWVGGDFMSGRFFAPMFLLAAMSVTAMVRRRSAIVAALAVLAMYNIVWPNVPAKTTASYDMAWPWRTQNGIKDERGGYHRATNVLFFAALTPRPDDAWQRDAMSVRMSPERVFVRGSVGRAGFLGGPNKYIIDSNALSDPLLAHLPVDESVYFDFNISHFFRPIPAGYIESRVSGRNLIQDPLIRDYYDRILRVTTGAVWSMARAGDIWELNVGRYRRFHRLVEEQRRVALSVPANNPRFSTDVGEVDDRVRAILATGRAGFLQLGPGIPMRAGEYRADWTGAVGESPAGPLGFVVVCHAGCTKVLRTAPVDTASYAAETGRLASVHFSLREAVPDLEYRLFVNERARVRLERVGLEGGPPAAR